MLINEEIIKILEENDLNVGIYLTLLFAVEQKLELSFFLPYKEEVKTLEHLNIIEHDTVNIGRFKFKNKSLWSATINSLKNIISKKKSNSNAALEKTATVEVNGWIDEWLPLFPKGLNKVIGYDIHGNRSECIKRMSKFRKDNYEEFNKETIIKATKLYLKEREKERWQFSKKNCKFIYDENGSMLDNYCNRIIEGDYDEDDLLDETLNTGTIKHW